jgi:hypothetical protein
MMNVTVLIDKLTEIERAIGVEDDLIIRNKVIDAQDCALQLQSEMAEMLRSDTRKGAAQITPDASLEKPSPSSGWRRASVAILPLVARSPLWRR